MKAKINGVEIEGTPVELALLTKLYSLEASKQNHELTKGSKVSFKGFTDLPEDKVFEVAEGVVGTFTLIEVEE